MKKILFIILIYLLTNTLAGAKTLKYDWLTIGKKSGEQIVTYDGHLQVKIQFKFSDRGRGPTTSEKVKFNKKGIVVEHSVSGKSYMGALVDENYRLNQGKAHWYNTQENETLYLDNDAYYVSQDGAPQNIEFLIRALHQAENNTLKLLPSGKASFQKLLSHQLSQSSEKKTITLFAINGLGFTPEYAWFDQDLHLFAIDYGWMGMIRQGWSKSLKELQELQQTAELEYHNTLAKEHSEKLTGTTRFTNINVYTATDMGLLKNTDVVINNGKISAVGEAGKNMKAQRTIDGQGMTLMPGLWDMHTHISIAQGNLNIANGVTSVRDLANQHSKVKRAKQLFDSGEVIGPNIYQAGFIDKKSPYSAPTGRLAETLEDALNEVDWYAQQGYPQIKIYSSIDPSWVKPIAKRIHSHGMRLSGHIPSFMTTEQAIVDGFDEIQHINMLFLNFLAGEKDDTRTPLRFTLVGDKAGTLDLDSDEVKSFIRLLKNNDIVVDPTVTIFHSMFINKAGEVDPGYQAIIDHLPANIARGFLASELEINADNEANYARSAQALLKMIKLLYDAGVRIVAGTDAIAGFTLHRELELYAEAGIPNDDILKIATVNSARIAGQQNTGTIEPGQNADLILIQGNPLEDISAIRKVAYVVKGQYAFNSAEIFDSIGIIPFVHFNNSIESKGKNEK